MLPQDFTHGIRPKDQTAVQDLRAYNIGVRSLRSAVLLAVLVMTGCWDGHHRLVAPAPPPSMPVLTIGQLLASPDSLLVDGTPLTADILLVRDFSLGSPPGGSPLAAFAALNGSPPGSWPASISDVYIWVIRDSTEVWSKTMSFYLIDSSRHDAHTYVALGGPLWDPFIVVDVVIGVRTSATKVSLARFRNVQIQKSI